MRRSPTLPRELRGLARLPDAAEVAVAHEVPHGAAEDELVPARATDDLEQAREVEVRVGHQRIERQRTLVRGDGLARPALILDGDAEVELVQRDIRIRADREPVVRLAGRQRVRREAVIVLVVQHAAEVIEGVREVRPPREGPLVRGHGARRIRGLVRAAFGVPGGRTRAAAQAAPWSQLEVEKIAHVSTLTGPSDIRVSHRML